MTLQTELLEAAEGEKSSGSSEAGRTVCDQAQLACLSIHFWQRLTSALAADFGTCLCLPLSAETSDSLHPSIHSSLSLTPALTLTRTTCNAHRRLHPTLRAAGRSGESPQHHEQSSGQVQLNNSPSQQWNKCRQRHTECRRGRTGPHYAGSHYGCTGCTTRSSASTAR